MKARFIASGLSLLLIGLLAGCSQLDDVVFWRNEPEAEFKIDPCTEVRTAIENDDREMLAFFGVPALIDPDLVTGKSTGLHCSADLLNRTFTLFVRRDSGQGVVLRNTAVRPAPENSPEQNAALDAIGDQLGVFVVTGERVARLEPVSLNEGGVPVSIILD